MVSSFNRVRFVAGSVLAMTLAASAVQANPVTVLFTDTPECKNAPPGLMGVPASLAISDEVGPAPTFTGLPPELVVIRVTTPLTATDCGFVVAGGNDYNVFARNTTGRALRECYIVADSGTTFGNRDGVVDVLSTGPVEALDAKKCVDIWPAGATFLVTLFNVAPNAAPTFQSLGVDSAAAGSTFNIVCNPNPKNVPTVSEWGLAALSMLVLVAGTVVLRRSTGLAA